MPGRSRWTLWLFGLLILSGLVGVVLHLGEIERFAQLAAHARPLWLGAAVGMQALTYIAAARVWQVLLRFSHYPTSLRSLIPLGIAKLFADQSMPSAGISGNAFFIAALSHRGIPSSVCFTALVSNVITYYTVYLCMALATIALLALHHAIEPWITALVTLFMLIAPVIPMLLLWLARQGGRSFPTWLSRLPGAARWQGFLNTPARRPRVLLAAALPHAAVFLLDTATLWAALHALGDPSGLLVAFPAFILASVAATVGPVPLGLGTFEATCVAVLGILDVPLETALAATLLLRGMTLWLPMLPGLWLSRRELARYGEAARSIDTIGGV